MLGLLGREAMSHGIYFLLTAKSLRPNTCRLCLGWVRWRLCGGMGRGEISGVLWRQADAQLRLITYRDD